MIAQSAWYLARGGQNYGPYTWDQIVEHARGGRITRSDKLFDPRSGVWARPSKIPGLLGPGGAAIAPAGMSTAATVAVGAIVVSAALLGSFLAFRGPSPSGSSTFTADTNAGSVATQEADDFSSTPPTVAMAPEGLYFKCTFTWQSSEGGHEDRCYLWIYTTDEGTTAGFEFGIYLEYGWDLVYLRTHTGSHYEFATSDLFQGEKVDIVVDVTGTGISGTVTKTNDVGSLVGGTFTGETISFDEYVNRPLIEGL